jgi:hypothetical protein
MMSLLHRRLYHWNHGLNVSAYFLSHSDLSTTISAHVMTHPLKSHRYHYLAGANGIINGVLNIPEKCSGTAISSVILSH